MVKLTTIAGVLTGVGTPAKWVGNTARDIGSAWGNIREAYEAARGPRKPKRPDYKAPEGVDGAARYAAAAANFGTDARKEAQILRSTFGTFWLHFTLFASVVIAASLLRAPFYAWIPALPPFVWALRAAVINHMVRTRRCDGLWAFIKSGDYAPERFRKN